MGSSILKLASKVKHGHLSSCKIDGVQINPDRAQNGFLLQLLAIIVFVFKMKNGKELGHVPH